MAQIATNLELARNELIAGNLIGFPTETVYGLAGNALSDAAVLKIFQTKNRPAFDPLIVHTHSIEEIRRYVLSIPDALAELIANFAPGPLTVLLLKNEQIPDIVTSGLDRVAFRIPNHPVALELLASLPFPLAAPSANPFGYVSPTTPQHVNQQLGDKINYILDGGACGVGLESTILGIEHNHLVIYRLGGVSVEDLQAYAGKEILVKDHSTSNPAAPGMLSSHYAPKKKLLPDYLLEHSEGNLEQVGYIGFDKIRADIPKKNQLLLSPSGDTNEAAKNLFATLRIIEEMSPSVFYVGIIPNVGLGRAINDRLTRAISPV